MNNPLLWRPQPIRMCLVSRSKLTGFAHHFGVYLEYSPFECEVLDLQNDEGLRVVSVDQFAQGRRLTTEHELVGYSQTDGAWDRVLDLAANPPAYDLLQRNCEHIARRVMLGESKSPQVAGFVGIAAGLMLLALFSKGG